MAEQARFRQVIGHFATGVAIVTALGPDGPSGLTANSLCSVSLQPLLLLVCLDRGSRTLPHLRAAGRFAVNVLEHEQHALSGVFASKRAEAAKFDGVPHTIRDGAPTLDDALAWLVCDLREEHEGGDHIIAIGEVRAVHHATGRRPLVWYRGDYGTFADAQPAEARLPS